jgi:hypothetical protein
MKLVAVVLVAFFMAAGCGGAQESQGTSPTDSQEETAEPASVDTGATADPTIQPPSTGSPEDGAATPCDQEPCDQ